ncbi:uncharacterized protein BX664DRAFT_328394 [Halteromyces radiatus]|uniref:uncharacterized protein n=1 Tax=Halteromyces radiatus TaxID=101107 RepID=UPI00221EDFDD|nr:uncharacterized protein BX664DRAFT_328394 [Halteromyces radiatus]KAI8092884.1 hypothetical protein BX664DRAFT_328394 [Halteromyces radiatus]
MELPWSNLLAMANALTGTPWLYFVLYLQLSLHLSCFQIGLLMAYLYMVRWMANNIIIYLFDRLSRHYSIFLTLFCILVGISSLLVFFILSSYSTWMTNVDKSPSSYYWYLILASLTLFGSFYLSLGVLVESVILKSWGEYRMYFYGHHRSWSEWTVVCLTGMVGLICFLLSTFTADSDDDDDEQRDTVSYLLAPLFTGMITFGVCVMCLIALFKIQSMPSDPTSLGLTPSTPWLLKNAVLNPSDLLLMPSYFAPYKPYSLFGEPLSHISEEDASMVQRMTSHPSLIRESSRTSSQSAYSYTTTPLSIHNSNNNNGTSSSYGATMMNPTIDPPNFLSSWLNSTLWSGRRLNNTNTTYSYDPVSSPVNDDDVHNNNDDRSSNLHHQQQQYTLTPCWDTVPSYELALFSFTAPDMPSIAMLPFIMSWFNNKSNTNSTSNITGSVRYSTAAAAATANMANIFTPSLSGPLLINPPPIDNWKLLSLQLTMFLLGCDSAMLQMFLLVYLYVCLNLPMFLISLTGSCIILSEILLLTTVTKWIHGTNFTGMTSLIHATLIICSFSYLWLQSDNEITMIASLLLPFLSSGVFYLAWLVASDRVNTLVWSDQQRICQRAILSTLFCYVGPMVGACLTGAMISSSSHLSSLPYTSDNLLNNPVAFSSVYHSSIGLLAISFVVSWGWSADD